jgi:hypothetical protein
MIPSTHRIRSALKSIPGALQFDPAPESVAEGASPATEIFRIDADAGDVPVNFVDENEEGQDSDAPFVVFEVPPSLTDAEIKDRLGDELRAGGVGWSTPDPDADWTDFLDARKRQSALPRSSWPVVTGAPQKPAAVALVGDHPPRTWLPARAVGTRALGISFHTSGASTILALALVPHAGVRGRGFSLPEQRSAQ